jgi:hypothetical protein
MNKQLNAYIAVHGQEAARTNEFLPAAYGDVLFVPDRTRILWGCGYFKDAQDLFALGITRVIHENILENSLTEGTQLAVNPISFFAEHIGFTLKFDQIESLARLASALGPQS